MSNILLPRSVMDYALMSLEDGKMSSSTLIYCDVWRASSLGQVPPRPKMLNIQVDQDDKKKSAVVNVDEHAIVLPETGLASWLSTGDLPQRVARYQSIITYLITQLEHTEKERKQQQEEYRVSDELKNAQLREKDSKIIEINAQLDQLRGQIAQKDSKIGDLAEAAKLEKVGRMEDIVRLEHILHLQRKEESCVLHDCSQSCCALQADESTLQSVTSCLQPVDGFDVRTCPTTATDKCHHQSGVPHQCSLEDACVASITTTGKRKRIVEDDSHERKRQCVR